MQKSTRRKLECAEQRWYSSWRRGSWGSPAKGGPAEAQQRPSGPSFSESSLYILFYLQHELAILYLVFLFIHPPQITFTIPLEEQPFLSGLFWFLQSST